MLAGSHTLASLIFPEHAGTSYALGTLLNYFLYWGLLSLETTELSPAQLDAFFPIVIYCHLPSFIFSIEEQPEVIEFFIEMT